MANQDRVGRLFQQVSGNQKMYRVDDDKLVFVDPADSTKRVRIDVGNVPTATTKTVVLGERTVVTTTDATIALTADASGTVYYCTKSSGTQTFTLPAAAAGLTFTFVCGHASGEILITPATGDAISVFTFAAIGADADTATVAPAAGTGIKNTAATNVIGDSVTLTAVDGTTWFSLGAATGIWASQ